MDKKKSVKFGLLVVLASSLFLLGFASAGSDTEVDIDIYGCNFDPDGDGPLLSKGFSIDVCSFGVGYHGMMYCAGDEDPLYTNEVGLGCARNDAGYVPGVDPAGACCPIGFSCNAADGGFICEQDPNPCNSTMLQPDCLSSDGAWLNGECICDRPAESCDIYKDEASCENDALLIGLVGVGRSEYCGDYLECGGELFTVPSDDCGCAWNGADGICERNSRAIETTTISPPPMGFECASSYVMGDCDENGERNVSWTSNKIPITGYDFTGIPDECFQELNCYDGEDTLICGGAIVKLPGFSLFSLFMSAFIIGIYYFMFGNLNRKSRSL